jgi:predicted kinase
MLTLIRGLPGSGKSTLAQSMLDANTRHYEADMYRTGPDGIYRFDPDKNLEAFEWCESMTYKALKEGLNVIVSNTFTTVIEMGPYLDIAEEMHWTDPERFKDPAPVRVIACKGQFQTIHGVPPETILKMAARWEPYPGEEVYIP